MPPVQQSAAQSVPLGDLARESRHQAGAHSRQVITEENLIPARKTLFPDITLEEDNSEAIVASMVAYRYSHTPEETENAIRDWYGDQDYALASVMRGIQQLQQQQTDRQQRVSDYNYYTPGDDPIDYNRIREQQRTAARATRLDQNAIQRNTRVAQRLQDGMNRVRAGLQRVRIYYPWFKVRTQYGYAY